MAFEIRTDINPKEFFPNSKHVINYGFTIGDKHYFSYDDHLNVPYERALSCLVYYKEVEMNVDHSFLEAHVQAVNNILLSNPINVFKIKQLNDQLGQRLKLPKDPELMYKLASVVYFDQHENPEVYEWGYNKRKIEHWKTSTSLTDFFLQKPLMELIPYLKYAGENLEMYSRIIEKVGTKQWETLHGNLSEEQKMTLNAKKESSPAATPQS